MKGYQEIIDRYRRIAGINDALELLNWDQQVMMPEEGIRARSKQVSALSRISHEKLASDELDELLGEVSPTSSIQDANIREIKREQEKARKVPLKLVEKISEKESEAMDSWQRARKEDDFSIFEPHLEEMVELKKEYAHHIDPGADPYRVLYEDHEPYLRLSRMHEILETLRENLTGYLERIREEGKTIEKTAFEGQFDSEEARQLNREISEMMGFEFERGRLDVSTHPFTSGNQFDTRITTRYNEKRLQESILPTMHETGHALYQQGLPGEKYGTPAGQSRELGIHESQSRLWENHVGRSKEFQKHLLPSLEERFPEEFESVTLQDCYESVNQVYERNPIRVNADELTYHLHIILRYEIERALIKGDIEVADLPETWDDKMERLLGFRPENDSEGVLQDVHWSIGAIGYFPTYTLGSVIAAQLFKSAEEDIEDLDEKIENGEFRPLLDWLRENIHQHGQRFKTEDLIEKATGEKPTADYFLDYIREKYSDLYGIEL